MIRVPPSRILPGPDDIHHHLERVFFRVAAQYDDIVPGPDYDEDENHYEDVYGDDLASISGTDASPAPSTPPEEGFDSEPGAAFNSAVECQRGSSSSQADGRNTGNALSVDDPRDDDRQYRGQDQDQDSRGTNGSYETAPESVHGFDDDIDEVSSAGMSHREMANAHYSLRENQDSAYLSIGNLMALGMYPWPNHSLLPIHRVNPRVLLAVPEDDTWPTYEELFESPRRQTGVSSLGSLFESLSLKTLPEDTHYQADQSENQRPGGPQSKEDKSQTFDTGLDKEPSSFSKNTNQSRSTYPPTYPTNRTSDIRINEMPGSVQDDSVPQTEVPMGNTPLSQNVILEPNDTEPDTENESNSTRGSSTVSQSRGGGRKPGAARGGRRNRNSQAPVQNGTPTAGNKKDSRAARGTGAGRISRSAPRSPAVGTNQAINAPQDQAPPRTRETTQGRVTWATAPVGQNHPVDCTALRSTNYQAPTPTSFNAGNGTTAMAPPSHTPGGQPSIAQANGGMPTQTARDPERWRHMMEVSHIFQTHVNEMIAGVENEDDTAEDFGLGEIRRRPMGAWYD